MIHFQHATLSNGLRVLVHEDPTTPIAAVNVTYNVGSRDEDPSHTGMAHLMEHYMFTGSPNAPDYDGVLQKVGAYNNAFTSQDLTNYYIVLPANNVETALWLESDRMLALRFEQSSLDVQKQVVMEEFKENYLNRPYGDLMMLFYAMVYQKHPYQWLPIGKCLEHIAEVDMAMIRDFHGRFYRPNNAVLVVAGNVQAAEVFQLADKWFGDIPGGAPLHKTYPSEDCQTEARLQTVHRDVPTPALVKGWPMCNRLHPDYYAYDLISDMFGTGQSSYLYQEFVHKKKLFSTISAAITGTTDNGCFLISGYPAEGVTLEEADMALSDYLYHFQFPDTLPHDLQKVQNRAESVLLNSEIKVDDRATTLAIGEVTSEAESFTHDRDHYFAVTEEKIKTVAHSLFREEMSNTLRYDGGVKKLRGVKG